MCLHCLELSQCRVLGNTKHSCLHPRDWRNRTISILSLQWISKPEYISLDCSQVVVGAIGKRAWGRRKSAQDVLVVKSDKNTQERLTGTPSLFRPHPADVTRGVACQIFACRVRVVCAVMLWYPQRVSYVCKSHLGAQSGDHFRIQSAE